MASPSTGVLDSMLQSTIQEKAREDSKEKPPAAAEKTKKAKPMKQEATNAKAARTGGASAKPSTGTEPKSN